MLQARLRSLDAMARLRSAAWEWLHLYDDGAEEEEQARGREGADGAEEAAAVVREAVEGLEAAAQVLSLLALLVQKYKY